MQNLVFLGFKMVNYLGMTAIFTFSYSCVIKTEIVMSTAEDF